MNTRGHEEWGIVATIDPVDANNADTSTDEIDMSKWSEIMAIVMTGAIAASGTFDFALYSATSSGGSFSAISGKSMTQLDQDDDNKQVIISLKADELTSGHRYVKGTMANSAHSQLVAIVILGRAKYLPATDDDLSSVDEVVA